MTSDQVCIFYHIPKCAGCTFSLILKNSYSKAYILGNYDPYAHLSDIRRDLADPGQSVAVSCHNAWGLHECFSDLGECVYVTMLREPFSLCRSYHNYMVKTGMRECGFREFLLGRYQRDLMVHMLGDGSLSLAKKRLEQEFLTFGLMEWFHASLELMKASSLPLRIHDYASINASRSERRQISDEDRRLFELLNGNDLELYAFACEMFKSRTGEAGIHLDGTRKQAVWVEDWIQPPASSEQDCEDQDDVSCDSYIAKLLCLPDAKLDDYYGGLLIDHFSERGDQAGVRDVLTKLNAAYPNLYNIQLAMAWMPIDQARGESLLHAEIDYCRSVGSTVSDSYWNKRKYHAMDILIEQAMKNGRQDDAAALLERIMEERGPIHGLTRLSATRRAMGRPGEALELTSRGLREIHRPDLPLRKEHAVNLRAVLGPDAALEYLATQSGDPDLAELHAILFDEAYTLKEMCRRHGRLLTLMTAPDLLCEHVLSCFKTYGASCDVMVNAGRALQYEGLDAVNKVFRLPDSYFMFERDLPKIDAEVFRAGYDAVLILMATDNVADYMEVGSLARELGGEQLCATFNQMFSARGVTALRFPVDAVFCGSS